MNYTVEVVEKIKDAMISVDAQLASDITKLDLSFISPVDVSIYTDYQTFLESTGVFDDMSVLKAYDDQIDKKQKSWQTQCRQSLATIYLKCLLKFPQPIHCFPRLFLLLIS